MDQLTQFREAVKRVINEWDAFIPSRSGVESETIFDEARDHYELVHTGWEGIRRVHGTVIHVDIRDGKIWIQHDGTEDGIANELMEFGVPKDCIVLGFHHPDERKYTDFAVA
jgi:hypothetical protein